MLACVLCSQSTRNLHLIELHCFVKWLQIKFNVEPCHEMPTMQIQCRAYLRVGFTSLSLSQIINVRTIQVQEEFKEIQYTK